MQFILQADSFIGVGSTSVILGLITTFTSLLFTYRRYKKHLMQMYRGQYKNIPNLRLSDPPEHVLVRFALPFHELNATVVDVD